MREVDQRIWVELEWMKLRAMEESASDKKGKERYFVEISG